MHFHRSPPHPPPRAGDPPQVWVELDTMKPEVSIKDVQVGRSIDKGNLTIEWKATDKNLKRQPITISYATKAEGPWGPIPGGTNLENSGKFVWPKDSSGTLTITREQFDVLVLGLPWQHIGEAGIIRVL